MNTTNDIKARLREVGLGGPYGCLCQEAADHIASLEAQIAVLEAQLAKNASVQVDIPSALKD